MPSTTMRGFLEELGEEYRGTGGTVNHCWNRGTVDRLGKSIIRFFFDILLPKRGCVWVWFICAL